MGDWCDIDSVSREREDITPVSSKVSRSKMLMSLQSEKFLLVQSRKFRSDGSWQSEEGLWMSTKERDRLKVLHEVKKRDITQKQAGAGEGAYEETRSHCSHWQEVSDRLCVSSDCNTRRP